MDMDKTFEEVERLRTDYLRELTALFRMLIALSSGALTLLLSRSGITLSTMAGKHVTVIAWILLSGAAALGFIEVYSFSSRSQSRADYLWACQLVDTAVVADRMAPGPASDERVNKLLGQADKYKVRQNRKYIACVRLVLAQGLFLLAAFGLLAYPIYRMLSGVTR